MALVFCTLQALAPTAIDCGYGGTSWKKGTWSKKTICLHSVSKDKFVCFVFFSLRRIVVFLVRLEISRGMFMDVWGHQNSGFFDFGASRGVIWGFAIFVLRESRLIMNSCKWHRFHNLDSLNFNARKVHSMCLGQRVRGWTPSNTSSKRLRQ